MRNGGDFHLLLRERLFALSELLACVCADRLLLDVEFVEPVFVLFLLKVARDVDCGDGEQVRRMQQRQIGAIHIVDHLVRHL